MLNLVKDLLAQSLRLGIEVGPGSKLYTDYSTQKKAVDQVKDKATAAQDKPDAGQVKELHDTLTRDATRDVPAETAKLKEAEKLIASGKPEDIKKAATLLKEVAESQSTRLQEKLDALRDPGTAKTLLARERAEADQADKDLKVVKKDLEGAKDKLNRLYDDYRDKNGDVTDIRDRMKRGLAEDSDAKDLLHKHLSHFNLELEPAEARDLQRLINDGNPDKILDFVKGLQTKYQGDSGLQTALKEFLNAEIPMPGRNKSLAQLDIARTQRDTAETAYKEAGKAIPDLEAAVREKTQLASAERDEEKVAKQEVELSEKYADTQERVRDKLKRVSDLDIKQLEAQFRLRQQEEAQQQVGPHDVGKAKTALKDAENGLKLADGNLEAAQKNLKAAQDKLNRLYDDYGDKNRDVTDIRDRMKRGLAEDSDAKDLLHKHLGHFNLELDQAEARDLQRLINDGNPEKIIDFVKGLQTKYQGDSGLQTALKEFLNAEIPMPGSNKSLAQLDTARTQRDTAEAAYKEAGKAIPALSQAVTDRTGEVTRAREQVKASELDLKTVNQNKDKFDEIQDRISSEKGTIKDLERDRSKANGEATEAIRARDAVVPVNPEKEAARVKAEQELLQCFGINNPDLAAGMKELQAKVGAHQTGQFDYQTFYKLALADGVSEQQIAASNNAGKLQDWWIQDKK